MGFRFLKYILLCKGVCLKDTMGGRQRESNISKIQSQFFFLYLNMYVCIQCIIILAFVIPSP